LDAEGGSAATSAFHVRVVELKAGTLEGLDIIDIDALQVHQRGRVNVDLQSVEVERLVHHSSAIFERHGVGESGAASADHAHAQACRYGILLRHDVLLLVAGGLSEAPWLAVSCRGCGGRDRGGCGCPSSLLRI